MTRREFINDVQYWSDLLDFCSDEGCDYCEDVYSSDQWNDWIDDNMYDWARNNGWREILRILQDYDELTGYDYYRKDEYGDWYGLDDNDFESYKNDVLEYMDDNDYWDEEEEEKPPAPYVSPEDIAPLETEDISIDDLFLSGIEALKTSQDTGFNEADLNSLFSA